MKARPRVATWQTFPELFPEVESCEMATPGRPVRCQTASSADASATAVLGLTVFWPGTWSRRSVLAHGSAPGFAPGGLAHGPGDFSSSPDFSVAGVSRRTPWWQTCGRSFGSLSRLLVWVFWLARCRRLPPAAPEGRTPRGDEPLTAGSGPTGSKTTYPVRRPASIRWPSACFCLRPASSCPWPSPGR